MKKVFSIIGICFGIMIMIMGFICMSGNYSSNSVDNYIAFGADFYTDEYEATAAAANNASSMVRALDHFIGNFGLITVCFGGVVTCYFFCVLSDTLKNKIATPKAVSNSGKRIEDLPDL